MNIGNLGAPVVVSEGGTLYDEKEAARRLRMSLPWLRARRRDKLAPVFLKIGSRVLYRESDLASFLASCAVAVRGGAHE